MRFLLRLSIAIANARRWFCGVWGHKWYYASPNYRLCWRCHARQVSTGLEER